MKITYLFIVLILFQSCVKKAENTPQLFDEEKILSAITVNSQLDSICYPGDLEIVDSLLFILDWQNESLARRDLIHFTKEGYEKQGELLYKAIMYHYERDFNP